MKYMCLGCQKPKRFCKISFKIFEKNAFFLTENCKNPVRILQVPVRIFFCFQSAKQLLVYLFPECVWRTITRSQRESSWTKRRPSRRVPRAVTVAATWCLSNPGANRHAFPTLHSGGARMKLWSG